MKTKHVIVTALATAAIVTTAVLIQPKNPQLYPNPQYTTGVIATQDYKELSSTYSCGTYSACHRLTTSNMKAQICTEYPDNCKGVHEIDHFCPLALGCADDVKNLWAQPEHVLVNGIDYGFHTKDKLETFLVIQMKAQKISPADAQNCILNDWIKCYNEYLGNKLGAISTDPDQ